MHHPAPARAGRAAIAVFALLLGIYLLTTGGHPYAVDEEMMLSLTESMALRHSFALNTGSPPVYSTYGPAQSIAALPFYAAGHALGALWPAEAGPWLIRLAISWFNPCVTAAVAALVVLAACELGYSRRAAVGAALLYGLGTMAWPHSKTFFAEPLTALVLFGSLTLALAARRGPRALALLAASGLLGGLAAAIKIQAGMGLPLIGLLVLADAVRARRWHAGALRCAAWGAGALVALGLLGWYQYALFGSPLRSGYGDIGGGFTTPFWRGFSGQLWSPGRGILWYAPPLALAPLGMWLMRRRHADVALLCGAMFMAQVLFYAAWWAWEGAGAWGPRFLNVALPFAALPLAAFLAELGARRWRRLALALTVAVALPVQAAGVLVNLNNYFSLTHSDKVSAANVGDSAILIHWGLIADRAGRLYDRFLAPASVALRSGFSYSEGEPTPVPGSRWGTNDEQRPQLPRWTLERAELAVRPTGGPVALLLRLSSCAAPQEVRVRLLLDGREVVGEHAPCPARAYRLSLPDRASTLEIASTTWDPVDFGGKRDEHLGVQVLAVQATAGGQPLALRGDPFAIPPMPNDVTAARYWMTDHRYAHWDFWWWYMAHTRYPALPNAALAAAWLAAALGLCGWGAARLRGIFRDND
ncbi:hypothetical protein F8S13_16085 [Chloroflexia bacterium SDU3-3]|nr:hypothetical protein F8S13_16085 [Chloroflexia bacterium SDU3-3]